MARRKFVIKYISIRYGPWWLIVFSNFWYCLLEQTYQTFYPTQMALSFNMSKFAVGSFWAAKYATELIWNMFATTIAYWLDNCYTADQVCRAQKTWFPQQPGIRENRELDNLNSWSGNTIEIWSKSLKFGNWTWIFCFSEKINKLGHTCSCTMLTYHVNLHCTHNKELISPWNISLPAWRLHAGAHMIF